MTLSCVQPELWDKSKWNSIKTQPFINYCWRFGVDWSLRRNGLSNRRSPLSSTVVQFELHRYQPQQWNKKETQILLQIIYHVVNEDDLFVTSCLTCMHVKHEVSAALRKHKHNTTVIYFVAHDCHGRGRGCWTATICTTVNPVACPVW